MNTQTIKKGGSLKILNVKNHYKIKNYKENRKM